MMGLLILLVAILPRIYGLDREPLTANESTSAALATDSWETLIHKTSHDVHPPFHYLFLNVWAKVFGSSESSLRMPSVISGVITAFVVWWWSSHWMSLGAAFVAGLVLALSPFHVHYSQEARFYAFLGLESALMWFGIWKLLTNPCKKWFFITLCVGIIGLYTHYYFGFIAGAVLGIAFILSLVDRNYAVSRLPLILLGIGMLVGFSPWLVVFSRHVSGPGAGSTGPVSIRILLHTYRYFLSYDPDLQPWRSLSFLILAATALFGLFRWAISRDRITLYFPVKTEERLAVAGILATTVFVFAVCMVKPLYIEKGMVIILPAYATLIALCWERMRFWFIKFFFMALVLLVTVRGLIVFFDTPRNKDWRAVGDTLEHMTDTGDVLFLREGLIKVPLHYYYYPHNPEKRLPEIELNSHEQTVDEQMDIVLSETFDIHRFWLVCAHSQNKAIRDSLLSRTEQFQMIRKWSFGEEGELFHFRRLE